MKVLSEIISELESGSRPKGGVTSEGDIPSLGAEHLDNDGGFYFKNVKRVSKEFFHSLKSGKLSVNDILIVKDGATTGKVSFISEDFPFADASINEHVFRIQINDKVAVPKYVFHFLKSELGNRQIMADFRGATVGGISRKFTDGVRILLPPLEEQQRIATILDHADSIRRKNKQILEKYNELAQSVFYEMFGDTKVFRSKKLIEIVQNGGKGTFSNGPFGSDLLTSELTDSGVPVIYIRDLRDKQYIWKSNVYVTREKADTLKYCQVLPNDILITKVGDPPGVAAVYPRNEPMAIITQDVIRLRTISNIANPIYVQYWINSSFGVHALKTIIVQGTRQRFPLGEFKQIGIPLFEIDVQNQFADIIGKIEKQKEFVQKSLKKSEDLFQSLLQRAFKGEI